MIDARSLKPPVKEDDAEREKRRASAEQPKSVQDAEWKEEKRKNLERQALEEHRAKATHEGRLEEDSPDEDDDDDDDGDVDSEGMAARLDRSYRVYRRLTFLRRVRGLPRGRKAETMMGAKRRRFLIARAPTRPLPPPRVGLSFLLDLPKRPARIIGSRPLGQGR